MPSILRRNYTPRLYVQFLNQSRESKTNSRYSTIIIMCIYILYDTANHYCSWLPSTIVTSQQYIKAIGCFRQLVGEAFLSNRKGLPLPS